MKNTFYLIIFLLIALVLYLYYSTDRTRVIDKDYHTTLIVYHPSLVDDYGYVMDAYKSVLQEEGVTYETTSPDELLTAKAFEVARNHPTMIFPDGIAQILPSDMIYWTLEYLKSGGNIMIVYDPGVKSLNKKYQEPVFTRLLGLQYGLYEQIKEDAYTRGYVQITDEKSAKFLQIPEGKIWNDLFIGGYNYPKLTYDMARNRLLLKENNTTTYAYGILENNEKIQVVLSRDIENGTAFYVNLPLGSLKAYGSDDLMIRSMLRTFLFKIARVPHLMNTPEGKGGFVINWHIDDNTEWYNIPYFAKKGYLRENMPASLHITAGEYVDQPGDWTGFDACGLGRDAVRVAMKYGTIGSHGGWRHNWFAKNILEGKMSDDEKRDFIKKFIKMNNDCLSDIAGYKVKEYSAPDGVHPQPVATEILDELGIEAYYFTGDSGSAPNRTFINGKMVNKDVFAFPILPLGTIASVNEMYRKGYTPEEVQKYIVSIIDFAADNRTVRLFYSHMYDFNDFPIYHMALENMMDHAEALQWEGRLLVRPMSYFAEFLHRLVNSKSTYKSTAEGLEITITCPDEGVDGFTIAIPNDQYKIPEDFKYEVNEDEFYYYITLKGSSIEETILVPYI